MTLMPMSLRCHGIDGKRHDSMGFVEQNGFRLPQNKGLDLGGIELGPLLERPARLHLPTKNPTPPASATYNHVRPRSAAISRRQACRSASNSVRSASSWAFISPCATVTSSCIEAAVRSQSSASLSVTLDGRQCVTSVGGCPPSIPFSRRPPRRHVHPGRASGRAQN